MYAIAADSNSVFVNPTGALIAQLIRAARVTDWTELLIYTIWGAGLGPAAHIWNNILQHCTDRCGDQLQFRRCRLREKMRRNSTFCNEFRGGAPRRRMAAKGVCGRAAAEGQRPKGRHRRGGGLQPALKMLVPTALWLCFWCYSNSCAP